MGVHLQSHYIAFSQAHDSEQTTPSNHCQISRLSVHGSGCCHASLRHGRSFAVVFLTSCRQVFESSWIALVLCSVAPGVRRTRPIRSGVDKSSAMCQLCSKMALLTAPKVQIDTLLRMQVSAAPQRSTIVRAASFCRVSLKCAKDHDVAACETQ